jgi:serine/threonine protein kinase
LLQALHSRGIVHCNLKPSNIFVDSDGHLVLADFRLAKVFDATETLSGVPPSGPGGELATAPFLMNKPIGTADYIILEVFCGEDYLFGVDYWLLGVVLYELFFQTVSREHFSFSFVV